MDLYALIPIAAVVVGIPGFVGFVALLVGHTRKMKELAIRERELELGGADAALSPAVDALGDELAETRAELAALQERLDFAERVLAAGSAPGGAGQG